LADHWRWRENDIVGAVAVTGSDAEVLVDAGVTDVIDRNAGCC
jgi:hypothetical protein